MRRCVLSLLAVSAAIFLIQLARAPKGSSLPHLSSTVQVCDYRYFIKKCLVEPRPYRPEKMNSRDACYPAIAYCLVRPFPMTPAGERLYIVSLFVGVVLGLAVFIRRLRPEYAGVVFLSLIFTTQVASGPVRGNPSAWAGGAILLFLAWYDSAVAWRRYVAALALAFAASLKISPAVFGLLYLRGRAFAPSRWPSREIVVAFAGFAVLLIVPFAFFGGFSEVGIWLHNALANSEHYGNNAIYGFMGIFDIMLGHELVPLSAWPVARQLTMVSALAFFALAGFAKTRYLALLLLGTGMAFVCHHDYGLVYTLPAFVCWLAGEETAETNAAAGIFDLLDGAMWFLFLTPLWYSFTVPVLSVGVRFQNEALIVLGLTAAVRQLMTGRKTVTRG